MNANSLKINGVYQTTIPLVWSGGKCPIGMLTSIVKLANGEVMYTLKDNNNCAFHVYTWTLLKEISKDKEMLWKLEKN
jgi:hypothetical protein